MQQNHDCSEMSEVAIRPNGYRWDEATKRYYKDDRRAQPAATAQSSSTAKKKQKNKHKQPVLAEGGLEDVTSRRNARPVRLYKAGKPPLFHVLDRLATQPLRLKHYDVLRQHSLIATFASLTPARTEQPNLSQGDTITCFDFDEQNTEVIRYGTSAGLLGKGRLLLEPRQQRHSVDAWEVEHILGAPISSLHTSQGFMVWQDSATSLGPIAQAVFGRTDTHAHVKLAPRQTSLWSSSIWATQVALGCDKKVLYARNPADQAFQSFGTGSAVFALDLQQDDLFVGTRSGHVRLFDVRQSGKSGQAQPPQILVRLQSPVTNIKLMADKTFIVAQMNGGLARYDSRFVKLRAEPITVYQGHVNTQSRALGFDICNDRMLTAAGEDGTIRSWLVASGEALASIALPSSERWGANVRETPLRYQGHSSPPLNLWISEGRNFKQYLNRLG
ncbi:hypothetical protein P389DRAFT_177516 [Cystobasidium minutum MCA 4210]|uniref:uncharacterized protein n=1 Tax=Cystobasidium minutum MCA 4210 TaxID=1397322 RepID=UPI0034CDDC9C|eukprot:jgi/Rhomi1/177516/fgenesh1_pg.1_\